jgi:membrane-associated phospholipid phosphatase
MAEALAQRSAILRYWSGLLMFGQASHPLTYALGFIAIQVGQFQAMHYKYKVNRPRASQLSNRLMPPIDPPGHASYPSGHATEAYLLSGVLDLVMPLHDPKPPLVPPPPPPPVPPTSLERLAERMARNREVLGLHYPSDSAAGKYLAARTLPLLLRCATVQYLVTNAPAEWVNTTPYP